MGTEKGEGSRRMEEAKSVIVWAKEKRMEECDCLGREGWKGVIVWVKGRKLKGTGNEGIVMKLRGEEMKGSRGN